MRTVPGVAIGIVSDIDAKLGRVKVKFPWMDDTASFWAPIASLLSGKKRGARFMPEIDDEALIAFDRGEFDHPYAIGFLWNGVDEAPDDKQSNRLIVTPGGHELRFEDKEGDRRVVLKTSAGHSLAMDDKSKSVTLSSKQGHELEILDQEGKVTLTTKSGGKITLEDQPGKAVIEASQNRITLGPEGITIEVTAGALNIRSSAAMTVMSTASMTIQAGGLVNLTASLLNVTAPIANFSGIVNAQLVRAEVISGTTYTPGVGNLL